MTDKQLKRLSRRDLLEMLLEISKENEQLKSENRQLKEKLENRKIELENCGSLAEAALKLNDIFRAADRACRQYIENIRLKSEMMDKPAEKNTDTETTDEE